MKEKQVLMEGLLAYIQREVELNFKKNILYCLQRAVISQSLRYSVTYPAHVHEKEVPVFTNVINLLSTTGAEVQQGFPLAHSDKPQSPKLLGGLSISFTPKCTSAYMFFFATLQQGNENIESESTESQYI